MICFILGGCSSDKKNISEDIKSDLVNDSLPIVRDEKIEKDITIVRPNKALLLLDISTSMKGYIDAAKDPRFSGIISSFLYLPTKIDVRLFDTKEQPSLSTENFLNKLNARAITWSSESNLKSMLATMVQHVKTKSDDVCFLLTDGIMSGSNEQVRNSPDRAYSVRYRTVMSNGIKELFSDSNFEMSALIIRYKSKFKGTYYCYTNDKITITEKERPFYVIAIGEWQYIKYIEGEILKNEQGDIGRYDNILILGDKLPYEMKISHGNGIKTNSSKKDRLIIEKSARSGQVRLTADLNNVPQYMQTATYMKANTELFIKHGIQEIKRFDSNYYDIEVETMEKGSRLVLVIDANQLRGSQLTYKLKYTLPEWITTMSCDDDRLMYKEPSMLEQTFNLKYFVDGFMPLNKGKYVKEQVLTFEN